ncbi:ABC transporter ATP-binding protein [Corticibacter populi]|uniref:ABC transporter ATP-binding protein n=1 Tax=Corticibacter populi TaxID=1550736 RepID=A0A3M6QTU0_9BURK|nr:ABC transporter ATP-binding protein [Corticibacter populi]RMX06448.1 ABC transporter ATP-binding protein [Corticibacter populi]RZS31998.1 sulfonate transport system ATP-binding protein [Corticibacter populi]
MATPGTLSIRNVSKRYDVEGRDPLQVLTDVNFDVEPGSFVSIVGPSGCGKSTILRLIAGLDPDYKGSIQQGAVPITGTSLSRGIVFQDHRLLPWLTLQQNIELALLNSRWTAHQKAKAIREHIELVGLAGFETAFPHQLSGGMAQRAAIARGLVSQPEILLLDEPLGALDALTRIRLQEELLRIWRAEGVTMILVTHDVDEAIYLSDRIFVMNSQPGRIVRDVKVPLPRVRDRASAAFTAIKREVLAAMGEYENQLEVAA